MVSSLTKVTWGIELMLPDQILRSANAQCQASADAIKIGGNDCSQGHRRSTVVAGRILAHSPENRPAMCANRQMDCHWGAILHA